MKEKQKNRAHCALCCDSILALHEFRVCIYVGGGGRKESVQLPLIDTEREQNKKHCIPI